MGALRKRYFCGGAARRGQGFSGIKLIAVSLLLGFFAVDAGAEDAQAPQSTSFKDSASEKYDTKLPVEISADNLEVLQNENKAIFKGNVIAVQGKIRLNADTMIVHYKKKDNQPGGQQGAKVSTNAATPPTPATPAASPTSTADAGAMGAITLIEVEGNVLAATPEESAKGDKGDYHVPEKMLHLTGDNVTLTRDKNILRGTELVYNLETGRSTLTNKGGKVNGTNGGRVRGLFMPNDNNGKDQNQKKDKDTGGKNTPKTVTLPVAQ